MANSTQYQRKILDHLQEVYGIHPKPVIQHGGRHPFIEFTYNSKVYKQVLYNGGNRSEDGRVINTLIEIKNLLGEPPEQPQKVKRSLDDMLPERRNLLNLEAKPLATLGDFMPNTEQTEQSKQHLKASVACYKNSSDGKHSLRFFIDASVQEFKPFINSRVVVTDHGKGTWEFKPNETGHNKFNNYTGKYKQLALYCNKYDVFARTDAEAVIVDGTLIISFDYAKRKPLYGGAREKVRYENKLKGKTQVVPEADSLLPPKPVTDINTSRLVSLLRDLKDIEEKTPYRLTKVQLHDGFRWEFRVPSVRLED